MVPVEPSGSRLSLNLELTNALGLHARAAALFVRTANRFRSTILVRKGATEVNGKSILGLLMLAASQGQKLTVHAEGNDALQALHELRHLIDRKFDEA